MRRADLLDVVQMTSTTFNALAARSLLPLPGGRGDASWKQYRPEDALRLMLLKELTRNGTAQARASTLIRQHFETLIDYVAGDPKPKKAPFMFGLASLPNASLDAPVDLGNDVPIVATLGSVDDAIATAVAAAGHKPQQLADLTLVNASACMRMVFVRARRAPAKTTDMHQLAVFMRAT